MPPTYSPDVDVTLAAQTQASLNFETPVKPGVMNAFIGERWDKAASHLALMGLTPIPVAEESLE